MKYSLAPIFILVFFVSFSTKTNAAMDFSAYELMEKRTYLGMNIAHHFISPKPSFKSLFRSNQPGLNLYVGYNIGNIVALELGYSFTTRNSLETHYLAGNSAFGLQVAAPATVSSQLRHKSTNLDAKIFLRNIIMRVGCKQGLMKNLPYLRTAESPKGNSPYISLGAGFVRPSLKIRVQSNGASNLEVLEQMQHKTKLIGRFGLGYEHEITESINLRMEAIFVTTRRMHFREAGFLETKYIFRNGAILGIGLLYLFA